MENNKENKNRDPSIDKDPNDRFGRDEMNLAEYPFTLLSRRPSKKASKTIEYTDWVTINGKKKPLKWIVTGSDKYGLPLGGDQDIYVAIMEVWKEHGFKDKVIPIGTIYRMLKRMGLPDDKQNYVRFKNSLNRFISTTIVVENAFWDREGQCYISSRGFHIFDEYQLLEKYTEDGSIPLPFGYVRASEFFYQSVKKGYLKSIDIEFYLSLPTPLTKRLYRYLDKKRYLNSTFSMELLKFAFKIGLMAGSANKYYPSKLKQLLNPALDELNKKGFLKKYDYQKMRDGKDVKIVFSFPEEIKTDYRTQVLIDDILNVTGAEHSRPWYSKTLKLIGHDLAETLVYLALSMTKDAHRRGEIRTTKDQYFINLLKRLVTERGISL